MAHDPTTQQLSPEAEDALEAAGVTPDYGAPEEEYRAVRRAAGVADREDVAHLALTGRDPVRMLQGLITSDLAAAPADRAVYGAMLTPKGRTIAELRALKVSGSEGPEVLVQLPREVLAAASEHLRRSVPPLYARWRDASQELAMVGVYGPRSRELLSSALGEAIPELGEDRVASVADPAGATIHVIGSRYAGGEEGYDLLIEREMLPRLRDTLLDRGKGWARPLGFSALEVLRIEAGVPRGGRELTEATIPTEAYESTGMMERAISFGKGCYTGQEVIVRIAHRGHVNRHLRGIVLAAEQAPARPGSRLHHPESGKDVGWVTSSARSPLVGSAIALAFLRREIEPGGAVHVGAPDGTPAVVAALPFRKVEAT